MHDLVADRKVAAQTFEPDHRSLRLFGPGTDAIGQALAVHGEHDELTGFQPASDLGVFPARNAGFDCAFLDYRTGEHEDPCIVEQGLGRDAQYISAFLEHDFDISAIAR